MPARKATRLGESESDRSGDTQATRITVQDLPVAALARAVGATARMQRIDRRCTEHLLVGFRITVRRLSELGVVPIGIAAVELVVVLLVLRWIAVQWFKLDSELALRIAAGSAICGAAAILCVAALTRAREQNVGIAIAVITVAGTLALLVYPAAFADGTMPAFDDGLYGIFVGSSICELSKCMSRRSPSPKARSKPRRSSS